MAVIKVNREIVAKENKQHKREKAEFRKAMVGLAQRCQARREFDQAAIEWAQLDFAERPVHGFAQRIMHAAVTLGLIEEEDRK